MRPEPSDPVVVAVTTFQIISDRNCIVQGFSLSPAAASCSAVLYDAQGLTESQVPVVGNLASYTSIAVLTAAAAGGTATLDISASGLTVRSKLIAVVTGAGAFANVAVAKI